MGTITESFANLTDILLVDQKKRSPSAHETRGDIFLSRVLAPLLPSGIRCGPATVLDIKDRQVGPFDIVGCWEAYPPIGDGPARTFLVDGVAFCLQVRDWASSDLTQFAELATQVKKLQRKQNLPLFVGAVAFERLAPEEVAEFLKSPAGRSIDGVLSVGHHAILRNSGGWYGNPDHIPFVTEGSGPEALKAFMLFLVQLSQSYLGMPFGFADYQHL